MVLSDDASAALRSRGSSRLWLVLGVPPLAWFAALNAAYFFVSWTCRRQNGELVLHAIVLVALAGCIAAGVGALSLLRDVGAGGQDDHDDRQSRTRFLGRVGLFGATIFALAITAQWLAVLILEPCIPLPRERFSPDALRPPAQVLPYARVADSRYEGILRVSAAARTSNVPSTTCGSHVVPTKSNSQGEAARSTPLAASSPRCTRRGRRFTTPIS